VLPGIDSDDRLIVWGGGVWDWLDPLTPIQAMEQVGVRHPSARLVFFEAEQYRSTMLDRAKQLAAERGLLGRHVVLAGWLPPEQWGSCLLEADVGLSFHPASIETHFAFRTRLLDYIWAGLPIATAGGDVLSDLVAGYGLGHVVEPGDAEALSKALIALLDEPQARASRREAFCQASEQFVWERVTQPLADYCRQPWHAGDHEKGFHPQWQAAQREHILARAAHAERRLAETQAQARDQTAHLQGQVDGLSEQLHRSKAQLEEAMGGRVMRLMTGIQRALRGDGG
jgi:hypothetical protein